MYQTAWNQLKSNPEQPLRIAAHHKLHPRIYKAIVKEKYMDLVYKLQLSELKKTATLSRVSKDSILTINLNLSLGMDDFT